MWRIGLETLARFVTILTMLVALSIALFVSAEYATDQWRDAFHSSALGFASIGFLCGIPFTIGGLCRLLIDFSGQQARQRLRGTAPVLLLTVLALVIGAILLREAIICFVLMLPFWIVGVLSGAWTVGVLQRQALRRRGLHVVGFLILPFVLLGGEHFAPPPTMVFAVERHVVIDASAEAVWQVLRAMPDIDTNEGHWTVTHRLFGVPQPQSAIISGEGVGAVRHAQWHNDVRFEEHIIAWQDRGQMRWTYHFPDDSVARHTDAHIGPQTNHMWLVDGGYRIEELGSTRTQLVLDTRFATRSHFGWYGKMWSELILGDILVNVLTIVEKRSENPDLN